MDIQEIINLIYQFAPPTNGEPQNATTLKDLRSLTQDLIAAYRAAGLLQNDPFAEVRTRTIHLHENSIREIIGSRTVLVTGGIGCIGSALIAKLIALGVPRVVSVDRVSPTKYPSGQPQFAHYKCDLSDGDNLDSIFRTEKPHVVFHLGAQRNPGLAERQIRDTLSSNVVGTANVLKATAENNVPHFVYSSTGKASRYLTSEVYAASKKLAEWQTLRASLGNSTTIFSAVRFTHVLDNSLVCEQIAHRIATNRPINVHAPHRYIIAQSRNEAVNLLLNSLVFSQPERPRLAVVRNLGWPGETLEHALYQLAVSKKKLPIFFQGLPKGYEEGFFAGQVPWSQIENINPLVNVLENHTRSSDSSGDTLLISPAAFDTELLDQHIDHLTSAISDLSVSDAELKWANARAVMEVARSSFVQAPIERVLQILRWGTEPRRLQKTGDSLHNHREIITLLGESITGRTNENLEADAGFVKDELQAILHSTLPHPSSQTAEKFAGKPAC